MVVYVLTRSYLAGEGETVHFATTNVGVTADEKVAKQWESKGLSNEYQEFAILDVPEQLPVGSTA